MDSIDFVFVDGIAVGLLVDDGRRRFCGATQTLADLDGLSFADVDEAQAFISHRLRSPAFAEDSSQ